MSRKSISVSDLISAALESIERFVRVPNKWETHLSFLLVRHGTSLSTVDGASVLLRDLINGEV